MNIQAFQKDVEEDRDPTKANIINREQDRMSGRRPIEFIQAPDRLWLSMSLRTWRAQQPSPPSHVSTRSAR